MPDESKTNNKKLFTTDFEVHASVKMLYPYIQTAGGLSEWFADDVNISPEKVFTFEWDHQDVRRAKMASSRPNHFCRCEFIPESDEDRADPAWFELRIETNELTQSTFIKISDYSDFDDMGELQDLWKGLVDNLRTVVGG